MCNPSTRSRSTCLLIVVTLCALRSSGCLQLLTRACFKSSVPNVYLVNRVHFVTIEVRRAIYQEHNELLIDPPAMFVFSVGKRSPRYLYCSAWGADHWPTGRPKPQSKRHLVIISLFRNKFRQFFCRIRISQSHRSFCMQIFYISGPKGSKG